MRYFIGAVTLLLTLGALVWLVLDAPWWIMVPAAGVLLYVLLSLVLGAGAAHDEERARREEPYRMWPPRS
jgi:hypothetical protein